MAHDVFISFSSEDREVADTVYSALEEIGVNCWIAHKDIIPAEEFDASIPPAVARSRLVLLVLSPHADGSRHVKKELACADENQLPILPLVIQEGAFPNLKYWLSTRQRFDATREPIEAHLDRLGDAVKRLLFRPEPGKGNGPQALADREQKQQRVAILYKRNIDRDEQVLRWLEAQLSSRGYGIFIDRHFTVGVEWANALEAQIRGADAVIPLLSESSVQSDMLAWEVGIASSEAQERGKPRLLPVRVGYEGRLPKEMANVLDPLQYFLWESPRDNQRLMDELLFALENPDAPKARRRLEADTGAVALDSQFYVVRRTDENFNAAFDRQDSIILIKGARQMGKTSLLARGLQSAREAGFQTAVSDFQKLQASDLHSSEALYLALTAMLADDLELDVYPDEVWERQRAPNTNFENFVKRQVLRKLDAPLVWGMDEVDRLLSFPFCSEVFGLIRSWHNSRATNPQGPWKRLTLAIVYATEAHLLISDLNQSPFNVGTKITLEDFNLDQLSDLNRRHGNPLRTAREVARLHRLTGGQPYLSRRALRHMVEDGLDMDELEDRGAREDGPFGDHLRRILVSVSNDQALCETMCSVLKLSPTVDRELFYRLRSGGVISGDTPAEARPRCELYRQYLERHLL